MVGKGKAVVAKMGVGISLSLCFSLPLVQPADVLEGRAATRVSLVQSIA